MNYCVEHDYRFNKKRNFYRKKGTLNDSKEGLGNFRAIKSKDENKSLKNKIINKAEQNMVQKRMDEDEKGPEVVGFGSDSRNQKGVRLDCPFMPTKEKMKQILKSARIKKEKSFDDSTPVASIVRNDTNKFTEDNYENLQKSLALNSNSNNISNNNLKEAIDISQITSSPWAEGEPIILPAGSNPRVKFTPLPTRPNLPKSSYAYTGQDHLSHGLTDQQFYERLSNLSNPNIYESGPSNAPQNQSFIRGNQALSEQGQMPVDTRQTIAPSRQTAAVPLSISKGVSAQQMPVLEDDDADASNQPISSDEDVATIDGPPTPMTDGSLPEYLKRQIGRFVRVEFILGMQAYMDRNGVLYEVGDNYIVLKELGSNHETVCDLYSIKFVNVFDIAPSRISTLSEQANLLSDAVPDMRIPIN